MNPIDIYRSNVLRLSIFSGAMIPFALKSIICKLFFSLLEDDMVKFYLSVVFLNLLQALFC